MSDRAAVLIRHGRYHQLPDTPSAHQPFALTRAGTGDATRGAALVDAMASAHGWDIHPVIHTSNLLRAWQTASILEASLPGVEALHGADALAERSVGLAANLRMDQIEQVLRDDPRHAPAPPGWKSRSDYRLPLAGAESLLDAGERVAGHLRRTMASLSPHPGRATMVLFVGHGAAFRHAAVHLGALELDEVATVSMFHAVPVALAAPAHGAWSRVAGAWKPRPAHDLAPD